MRKTFIFIVLLLVTGVMAGYAQTICPKDMVCITKAASEFLLKADDRAKASEATAEAAKADAKAARNAQVVTKEELVKIQIELAKTVGENTTLKSDKVRTDALIELLVKMVRPKKVGFINLF